MPEAIFFKVLAILLNWSAWEPQDKEYNITAKPCEPCHELEVLSNYKTTLFKNYLINGLHEEWELSGENA